MHVAMPKIVGSMLLQCPSTHVQSMIYLPSILYVNPGKLLLEDKLYFCYVSLRRGGQTQGLLGVLLFCYCATAMT